MKKNILLLIADITAINLVFSQGTAINSSGAKADSSAILDLTSTSKGILVPRMLKAEKLAISNPANGLLIYQTDDTTGFWYFNSIKWVQATGPAGASGATGPTGSSSPSASIHYHPGMAFDGGIVTWVDNSYQHGFITAASDQSASVQWYNGSYMVTVAAGTTIGTGQSNTTAVVNAQGAGSYAASICDNLTLNAVVFFWRG